ncbi:MAG: hypothetical protein KAS71_05785, partial [Bacteroidales bacterium]|nr:hypothetical protein [Bacteroidales bacterium]
MRLNRGRENGRVSQSWKKDAQLCVSTVKKLTTTLSHQHTSPPSSSLTPPQPSPLALPYHVRVKI